MKEVYRDSEAPSSLQITDRNQNNHEASHNRIHPQSTVAIGNPASMQRSQVIVEHYTSGQYTQWPRSGI